VVRDQTTVGSARNRLLDAASQLFYSRGMVATGIDAITTQAGVAKMSLYNNFSSKDELMLAYIEARHEEWLELCRARSKQATSAVERVLAVFDAYVDHASAHYEHGFRGCGLLNAAAELPAGSPGRDAVRRHKEQVESILAERLTDLVPAPTAAQTAEHLSFLLEGATSRAGLEGRPDRLLHARELASTMLEAL
jgi:AcrR family transcriptional regulator